MVRRAALLALVAASLAACGGDDRKDGGGGGGAAAAMDGAGAGGGAGGYGYAANLGNDLDKKVGDALKKAQGWLLGTRDAATGSWGAVVQGKDTRVGLTALALQAYVATLARENVASDPVVSKGLQFVAAAQKPNGAIYGNADYVNYETSVAVGALASAKVAAYAGALGKARSFLENSQVHADEASPDFGGFPYKDEEPDQPLDLSNLQFAVQALHDAGLPDDSPVFARVRTYLSRVQNRSESNTFVAHGKESEGGPPVEVLPGNDGGAFYAPGVSKVGLVKRADGKYEAKSYGSMTYALVKCLLFSGVKADDPRVVAALGWISKHFAVDRNPGFEQTDDPPKKGAQGHYYYLFTMTRALAELERATGKAWAPTIDGRPRPWRREAAEAILSMRKPDGSWLNDKSARWEEGTPLVSTAYLVQALATCQGRIP